MEGESSHRHFTLANKSLSVLYFNARSIVPKFDTLCLEAEMYKPDVICIVETWLCEDISDQELLLSSYQLFRLDRNRHGGGVLMYVKSNLSAEVIIQGTFNLEFLSICVKYHTFKCCISLFYRPPSSSAQVMDNLFSALELLIFLILYS